MSTTTVSAHIRLIFGSILIVSACIFGFTPAAKADPAIQPLTIVPLCSTSSAAAVWRIGNPNPNAVDLTWDAAPSNSATLPYGYTTVTTTYDVTQSSPVVAFHQDGYSDQTIAVSSRTCAEPITGCVDGMTRSNLQFVWSADGRVTVTTVDSAPLCDDVTVYFSDYTLPASYDESGIFDDSSIPQNVFASTSAVLQKGTSGGAEITVAVPDACTDYQLDLYYAPEITTVSYHGQGAQLIYGNIYLHTATICNTVVPANTGQGNGGQILGNSTSVPANQVAAAATLANTGQSTLVPSVVALTLMAVATATQFPVFRVARKLLAR